jgi:hypothetical protein
MNYNFEDLTPDETKAYNNIANLYSLYVGGKYDPTTDSQNTLITLNMDIKSLGSKINLADMPDFMRFKQAVEIGLGM